MRLESGFQEFDIRRVRALASLSGPLVICYTTVKHQPLRDIPRWLDIPTLQHIPEITPLLHTTLCQFSKVYPPNGKICEDSTTTRYGFPWLCSVAALIRCALFNLLLHRYIFPPSVRTEENFLPTSTLWAFEIGNEAPAITALLWCIHSRDY